MPTFTVTRDETADVDAVYDVDPLVDTFNPFGNYCVIKADDRGGQQFENFERGTRIDVAVEDDGGVTYDRFTGYVVERRETEQSGADVLEVEAYSFDQFLRRNTVTNDQSGNLLSEALQDIIQTDTPVNYVASNINVGDEQELTRSYQGVKVENVLRDLAFKSNNETFGVNDDLEFFFRPRETQHIDRGVDNSEWFNYDIPELGKEAINEVEVWFDDGDRSVIVDDGTDKLDLQENLNLPEPGTQRQELNRPLVTNINDAEDVGRKYLAFRNATLSGTVTTYGLYNAEPGDTIDITIDPRGIDEEFVIAAVEYRWGVDQTILTIVEQRGDVDDILAELSDSVQRQEMESANRDAPSNRITTTNATAIISVDVEADGVVADGDRFVNDGRRAVRDAWADISNVVISNIVVGDDGGSLSRSNTSLNNQTNSASVTQSLPDAKTVTFEATITQTGVQEVGLEASDGALITRATFSDPVDVNGPVTVTLTVSNDDSVSRGVITNTGQTAVRDVLADNAPDLPTDYAFGSADDPPQETDSSLVAEVVSQNLDEITVGEAVTESEWANVAPNIPDDQPLTIAGGTLAAQRVTSFTEAENAIDINGTIVDEVDYSGFLANTQGVLLDDTDGITDYVEFLFSFDHRVPSGEAVFDVFATLENFDGEVRFYVNDSEYRVISFAGVSEQNSLYGTGRIFQEFNAGETYNARIELTTSNMTEGSGNGWVVDTMQVIDTGDRYGGFGVNRSAVKDPNAAEYETPQRYPDLQTVSLSSFDTTRGITEARVESDWNNVQNNQYIELANDGSTFIRTDNAETATANFAGLNRGLDVNLGVGRYAADPTSTPTTGDSGQAVNAFTAFANPQAISPDNIGETLSRAVISPNTIDGSTIREAGIKSNGSLLTRHVVAEFDVLQDQRLASSETTKFVGDN